MPLEKHFPQPGVKVWAAWKGGRNGKPGGAILTRAHHRGGGKHPGLRNEASFAGRFWNEGLDRSASVVRVSSLTNARAGDRVDALWAPRRGTSSAYESSVRNLAKGHRADRGKVTRPSLGPKARARRSSLHIGRRKSARWWRGRGGIAIGQTHGSERNQHRGRHERTKKCTARRATTAPVRERACRVREGRRLRSPSLRGT